MNASEARRLKDLEGSGSTSDRGGRVEMRHLCPAGFE
jgi:hypothetical protein